MTDTHRVLLVEDNEMNREMLIRRLSRAGFEVLPAGDGQTALDRMRAESPDLVLMDFHLGDGVDGLEVLNALPIRPTSRSVIITADRSPELEARIEASGLALIRKPLRPAALRALLSNLLRESRAEHAATG